MIFLCGNLSANLWCNYSSTTLHGMEVNEGGEKPKKEDEIVVSTDGLNRYGFRVLSSGLDWSEFDVNPVLLYNHIRVTDSWDRADKLLFPLGRWEERRVDGDRIVMRPVFNEALQAGADAAASYRGGFLNTASIHFKVIEASEAPELMLPGQTRATVTRAKVLEVSLTDIPGNAGCHRLSFDGDEQPVTISLADGASNDGLDKVLPLLRKSKINKSMDDVKLLAQAMGMPDDTNVVGLVAKATELKNRAEAAEAALKLMNENGEKAKRKALIDGAIAAGKLTEGDRATWEQMAESNFAATEAALTAMKAYTAPTGQLETGAGGVGAEEALVARYKQLDKEGKLAALPVAERDMLVAAYIADLRRIGVTK